MSNTGRITCTFAAADSFGNPLMKNYPMPSVAYDDFIGGVVLVPEGAVSGAEFDVSLPTGYAASTILVMNETGQELNTAWGGNWAPHLPDGGYMMWALPSPPATGAISSWRFMLTQNQSATGRILYWVYAKTS